MKVQMSGPLEGQNIVTLMLEGMKAYVNIGHFFFWHHSEENIGT
jgi:hypothetical protein